ncbi:hypothetical protein Deipe_0391 [Deinococcus peraridilitoris DSM 19664]|uniref:Uncharacterized protein n=2 Tax=Deinococcus TaxID=1298 RepID=K9ZWN0_DEIPD|nr:hypothetical protein Deipe_0391 [Deinococcus peraridilitoris DSM 19664]
MLELVYDKDVRIAESRHMLELYLDEKHGEALAVFIPQEPGVPQPCHELHEIARALLREFVPTARLKVLLCNPTQRSFQWLDISPTVQWRPAPVDEVRGSGLAWA